MGTTKSGIWFPEPGDTYNEVSTLATMASSIETVIKDSAVNTGEVSIIPESGYKLYSSYSSLKVKRVGNVVYLVGTVSPRMSANTLDELGNITTLPDQFRPTMGNHYAVQQGTGANRWLISVNTNGNVIGGRYGVSSYVPVTDTIWMPIATSWVV